VYDSFHALYGHGELGADNRNRFLLLQDGEVHLAVDLTKCGWDNGWIKPFDWREYPELELAVATTIIRGV
jgi:hypothetical protein